MAKEYTLYFPFFLSETENFILPDNDLQETGVNGITFSIKREPPIYALKIIGLKKIDGLLDSLYAGFLWMMINHNIAFKADYVEQKIHYATNPIEAAKNVSKSFGGKMEIDKLDALIDRDRPAIYPEDKKIYKLGAGSVRAEIGRNWVNCFDFIKQGFFSKKSSEIIKDKKLFLALDLYRLHFFESSPRGQLLILFTALEVLLEEQKRPTIILKLIKKWKEEVEDLIKGHKNGSNQIALSNIKHELLFKEERSIRAKIKTSITKTFKGNGTKSREYVADAIKIYDTRSRLVHTGNVPDKELKWAQGKIKEIMQNILKIKMSKFIK